MQVLDIDGLTFTFPEHWMVSKFDEWKFYRNQFVKQIDGIKAVDGIAVSPERWAFLIEVKDYRHLDPERPSQLPLAIANKVLYTLAAMLPAKLQAVEEEEKRISAAVLKSVKIRVIVHIEQPIRPIPIVDVADVKQKLQRLLRAIDPHPKVVSMNNLHGLAWAVTD